MWDELAKYRGKGIRYRGKRYSPYSFRTYDQYRRSPYNISRYAKYRGYRGYRSRPEGIEQYAQPQETYSKQEKEPETKLLSKEEFFQRYPPSFPEHWSEEFRKEVMDRMYDRYVENAVFEAFKRRLESENEQKEQEAEDFKQDPRDRLLEIIKEKGIESEEGKAAYEELLRIQHEEVNRAEEEYRKGKLGSQESFQSTETEASLVDERKTRDEAGSELQEQKQGTGEMSQAEVEEVMEQLESELFEPEEIEPELSGEAEETAEQLSEEAMQMGEEEVEALIEDALTETEAEYDVGAESEYEEEDEW